MKDIKIIRKLVSKEMCDFLYNYFRLKRKTAKLMFEYGVISSLEKDFGVFGDGQAPSKDTFCLYGDLAFETLLTKIKPRLEKHIQQKLIETYAYARIYTKGDDLKTHKDRKNCDHSITLNVGGARWPFYIEDENHDTIEVILKPGDAIIYRGEKYRHWRDKLEGEECAQVFLHYITEGENHPHSSPFDFRPSLGLSVTQAKYMKDAMQRIKENENN